MKPISEQMKPMWSDEYQPLSNLRTRGNDIADLAWRDGKLYFALRPADDTEVCCDERAVEVADVEDAPQQETQILESASVGNFYILSGERTFLSHTRGRDWEEL